MKTRQARPMRPFQSLSLLFWVSLLGLLYASVGLAKTDYDAAWRNTLKPAHFGDKTIIESTDIIQLTAPYRAEDAAMVPVSITSQIAQTPERYIKTITLFIDHNPEPLAAVFHFTPDSGKADLAMRLRVNTYTNMRAIAELNDGSLTMHKVFIKASGGCSAPLGADLEAAMQRLGKMKFRKHPVDLQQPTLAELLVSHPNITGLQMNQVTRMITPAHFIENINISFNGTPVMTADTTIAISANPNFRFYFVPVGSGELKAEVRDNKGGRFSQVYEVTP